MDQFKEMAEVKMREAIEGQIQGEIDTDQAKLVEAEQELARLGSEDVRVAKRQSAAPGDLGRCSVHQPPGTQSGSDHARSPSRPTCRKRWTCDARVARGAWAG